MLLKIPTSLFYRQVTYIKIKILLLLLGKQTYAQPLLTGSFNYPPGILPTSTNWVNLAGSGTSICKSVSTKYRTIAVNAIYNAVAGSDISASATLSAISLT